MDASTYSHRASACLARIEAWLEAFDPDELDYSSADGVIKLEFADRTTFVLNRQSAAQQMWFAAGASAWHYNFDEASARWRCDKDGHELLAKIGEVVSARLGQKVQP